MNSKCNNIDKCSPEVFAALTAPGVETEGAEPLVDGDGHGGDVERREDGDPQLGRERQEEGEQGDVRALFGRGQERYPAEEVRHGEVYHLRPGSQPAMTT